MPSILMSTARIPSRIRAVFAVLAMWAAAVGFAAPVVGDGAPRYAARFASGRYLEGEPLSNWHSRELQPQLAGQPLFDAADPLRWLMDRSLPPPVAPAAYLEMAGGDRLPGRVIGYRPGGPTPFAWQPAHFLVECHATLGTNLDHTRLVRHIDARFVQRIVWQNVSGGSAEPHTVWLAGGSRLNFRSIRFSDAGLTLLLDRGIRRVAWSDAAELHLAPLAPWPLVQEELAELAADGQSRLLQVETRDGLIATTSLARSYPRAIGDERDVGRWMHGIQPAWSLDVLWVRQSDVWMRRSWLPTELPLSRLTPVVRPRPVERGAELFPPQVNRRAGGGLLRTARHEVGWGWGVHAFSDLAFPVPPLARRLATQFALDASMGRGGCVAPCVLSEPLGQPPLFQGPVVTGADHVLDVGPLDLTSLALASAPVVLQVDPVELDLPPGADPGDVRDHANWIEPIIELDEARLQSELADRVRRRAAAWQGWDFADDPPPPQWQWSTHFAAFPGTAGAFLTAVRCVDHDLTWRRTLPGAPVPRWLVIDAVRWSSQPAARVSVRKGGEPLGDWELPAFDPAGMDLRPLVLSLAPHSPPEQVLEVTQHRGLTPVIWRWLGITDEHPLVMHVYGDTWPTGPSSSRSASGVRAAVDDLQKLAGSHSVRIEPGGHAVFPFPRLAGIAERPRLGEFRLLRCAVRHPGRAAFQIEGQGASGEPLWTYVSGDEAARTEHPGRPTRRLPPPAANQEWRELTRDLYGDWGSAELAGITVRATGSAPVWIDEVFLARTQQDLVQYLEQTGHIP